MYNTQVNCKLKKRAKNFCFKFKMLKCTNYMPKLCYQKKVHQVLENKWKCVITWFINLHEFYFFQIKTVCIENNYNNTWNLKFQGKNKQNASVLNKNQKCITDLYTYNFLTTFNFTIKSSEINFTNDGVICLFFIYLFIFIIIIIFQNQF